MSLRVIDEGTKLVSVGAQKLRRWISNGVRQEQTTNTELNSQRTYVHLANADGGDLVYAISERDAQRPGRAFDATLAELVTALSAMNACPCQIWWTSTIVHEACVQSAFM
jgi:hypothetical protein